MVCSESGEIVMSYGYTDEVNTLILISLLKQHYIRKIIVSPGTTNISFVGSVQFDPWFEVYSAVDERSAAYMACGLAEESGEPVVLSCTGATASRNYLPGLTEAYYRHLPVLAVTSTQHIGRVGNYVAQVIDRSQLFPDLVKKSIQLPTVHSNEDEQYSVTAVNVALLELTHGVMGPVHINLATTYSNNFIIRNLPEFRKISRVSDGDFPALPKGKIAVFIGAHGAFSEEETEIIDAFCEAHDAIVLCDHVSNFRGKYRYLASLVNSQNYDYGLSNYDLIIYIGYVHGTYLPFSGRTLWRVNPDGIVRDPYKNLTYVFEMEEIEFFRHYQSGQAQVTLLPRSIHARQAVESKLRELPFSNVWIAKETAGRIPKNSVLHLSILNTLRVWNYFETPASVLCYSNTGGYGIDGCLSSCIGSAIANEQTEHFIVIGDLSFFYDLNSILSGIPANMHILLINNGLGTEFKNYNHRASYFGDDADRYMAAKGHNGFKNAVVVDTLCKHMGIRYLFATNKDEYLSCLDAWMLPGPVLLEVFTNDREESDALRIVNTAVQDTSFRAKLMRSPIGRVANIVRRWLIRWT